MLDKKALWNISYGLYVVTSRDGEKLNGQIANTVMQVASEPPLVAIAINKKNYTHEFIERSGVFAVSVLEESVPMKFIGLFGFKCGRETNKLSQCNYKIGITGVPIVIDNTLSVFECETISSTDAMTHTVFIGRVVSAEVIKDGTPLTYDVYRTTKKGKEPENAPTYRGIRG